VKDGRLARGRLGLVIPGVAKNPGNVRGRLRGDPTGFFTAFSMTTRV
jgi:hypothetical protein